MVSLGSIEEALKASQERHEKGWSRTERIPTGSPVIVTCKVQNDLVGNQVHLLQSL